MDSLDSIARPPDGALTSPAARRNSEAILNVLKIHLPATGTILEIASGTGEHAVVFANALPELAWTPSDFSIEARTSVAAWREKASAGNLRPPLTVDCLDAETWPQDRFDAVFCANMTHISPWAATEGLMGLCGQVLRRPGGLLALYGPYREADVPLAPSNAAFDDSLKARNPEWGLREREAVEALARSHGLIATARIEMPANNLMLLFRRA
jgi:hypothetical protein